MLAYVWLLGFPAPATRSAAMLALLNIGQLRQRVVAPRGIVALAALCVMLGDPWSVQSVGAWLSVAAVAAVIWAGRATERHPKVVRALAPAAAATLLTAPITAYAFGTVAPIGVLANLAAIPLAGLAVPGLMVALLLSSSWLAAGAGLCLALLDAVARTAAALPGGHFVMIAGPQAAALWLGILVLAWWLWNSPRRRWTIAARLAFVAALATLGASFGALRRLSDCQCLTVSFLDVGQGDAIALRSPAGRWVLIDGGPRGPQGDAGGRVVVPCLGHHGSRGATSNRWLDELQPAEAVISVGTKNRYGHPAPETLARLREHGVTVLRTDQRGTITFTVSSHGTLAIADVGHHD